MFQMAPPSSQKHLIHVEKSKTKIVKFKNGFPPKIIRSRESLSEITKPNQRIDLLEVEKPLKKLNNSSQRNVNSRFIKENQQGIAAEPFPNGSRCGLAPSISSIKHGSAKKRTTMRAPFSPPPTMSELRSLTKKIGRFYTVNNGSSSAPPSSSSRNPSRQKVILDIEKALSEKDVHGLEQCYKKIFQGNAEPIRTIMRNQYLPNQRSRQASCPIDIVSSVTKSASSAGSSTFANSLTQHRRWSVDSATERLPIVPAPYFRNESCHSPKRSQPKRFIGEGPVMYSSPRHDYRKKTDAPPTASVLLSLDPEQFPAQIPRTSQLDAIPSSANGMSNRPNTLSKSKRPIIYKSTSQWNQRAPNSTPEPRLGNEMQIISVKHKDLLPQVFPAQLQHNPEQLIIHANRRVEHKQSKNRFDTNEARTEPQSAEASTDRREITDDVLTKSKRVLTSGEDSNTECDYNDPTFQAPESHKRTDVSELAAVGENLVSGNDTSQETVKSPIVIKNIESGADALDKNIVDDSDLHGKSTSMVESIDLQSLEINSLTSSVSDVDENNIAGLKSGSAGNNSIAFDSRNFSGKNFTCEAAMNDIKDNSLENVTVVVVNVTTDEGEDVNADIYEYNKLKEDQASESFEQDVEDDEDEANKENGQPAARNRKEELEALLKEHSSIVEQVKNLSES